VAFNLGIDVDDARVVAAAERDGAIRMVSLSRTARAMVPAAYVGDDGEVAVGDDAAMRGGADPDGYVADLVAWLGDGAEHRLNGWAVTGEVLFAHLLAHVVRVAAAEDEVLGRATIAYPGQWPPARVDATRAAAGQAGIVDVELVERERAVGRAPAAVRDDVARAGAVGAAALAASRRSAPAPTEAVAPVAADAVPAPDPVTGTIAATTVFGELGDLGAVAGAGGAGGGDGWDGWDLPGGPDDGGSEPPRDRLPLYIAGGVLGVLLLVLVLVLVLRGGDDGDDVATGSSTTSSSTTTSTTSTSTTTSTTSTTTTTTTVPGSTTRPTSTTIPRPIGRAGLLESGLVLDYGTSASETIVFGDLADEVLTLLQATLGAPDGDSGWRNDTACTGETRRVTWGDLEIVLSRLETDDETIDTFEQWFVDSPGTLPVGLSTLERVGIGSLVADLKAAYPALDISHPISGSPTGFFTTQPEGNDLIAGFTTDTTDPSKVTQMWAGAACARLADAD
jgi:hypothetical protein